MNLEKFNQWNLIKKKIHFGNKKYFDISEGQIWYVSMGNNIGFEEDGKGKDFLRPVLVIKKTGKMIFCISLTSQEKNKLGEPKHLLYSKSNLKPREFEN